MYIWRRNQTYTVESAPTVTGPVVTQKFGLFLGRCRRVVWYKVYRRIVLYPVRFLYSITQRNNFNIFKGGSVSWAFTTGKIVCVHLQPYPIKNQCKNKFKKTILVNSCTCVDDMGD